MGEHTFPTRPSAHFTSVSSRLRDASGALDDMSLRKIAVAKRLGKVFCMGIWVCLFEGVHLTSSLSRSDGGDSGGLLKAVSQTFLLSWCCCCTALGSTQIKLNKLICWLFDFTPFVSMQCYITDSLCLNNILVGGVYIFFLAFVTRVLWNVVF